MILSCFVPYLRGTFSIWCTFCFPMRVLFSLLSFPLLLTNAAGGCTLHATPVGRIRWAGLQLVKSFLYLRAFIECYFLPQVSRPCVYKCARFDVKVAHEGSMSQAPGSPVPVEAPQRSREGPWEDLGHRAFDRDLNGCNLKVASLRRRSSLVRCMYHSPVYR